MTFEYTDRDGDSLRVMSHTTGGPGPIVSLIVARADGRSNGMFVPVDRVEEVVAGVRDAARQAAGRAVCRHPEGYEGECPCRPGCACCRVTAAVGQQPDACPTPETHNWGCGCPTDQRPAHARAETEAILHDAMTHGVVDETVREKLIAQHREAVARETAVGQQPTQQPATDLPERLAAILTERFTALGNPFSGMRINFQSPDEWPASREVSPNDVAEVLRDLLADGPAS